MDKFIAFLESLKREDNSDIIKALNSGYKVFMEAESINKKYFLKLANNDIQKVKEVKSKINTMWESTELHDLVKKPQKILALLYMFELKHPNGIDEKIINGILELAKENKLNLLDKYNSETSLKEFKNFISPAAMDDAYFLTLTDGNKDLVDGTKTQVNELWKARGMNEITSDSKNILPYLYMIELKKPKTVNGNMLDILHDLIGANKIKLINTLNTDSTPEDIEKFIKKAKKEINNLTGLTPDEEKIWNRVKTFYDFGNGFKWVVALDEKGNVSPHIPSTITFKMAKHCGNSPRSGSSDQYFELRKNQKPYLTVILDNQDKIAEAKSFHNKKNANPELVLPYYKWFLSNDKVKGVGQRYSHGYSPDTNMGLKDFFGHDDEFVEYALKNKPELAGATEKKIIDYKRKHKDKTVTEEEVIEIFKKSSIHNLKSPENITLWELRGIIGRIPFSEQEIIELIKSGRLGAIEIANTNHKLLTDEAQKLLLEKDNNTTISTFVQVYENVPTANIRVDYIIAKNPSNISKFDSKERINIFNKYTDIFKKAFGEKPQFVKTFMSSIPEKDRMYVIDKAPEIFEGGSDFITMFSDEDKMKLVEKFQSPFARAFIKNPALIGNFGGDENKLKLVLDKYHKIFKVGFAKQPELLRNFKDDESKLKIVDKFSQIFSEVFKQKPTLIETFNDESKLTIFEKYPETFSANISKDPAYFLKIFKMSNRINLFNKYPKTFFKGMINDVSAIEEFPSEHRIQIFNKYPEFFGNLLSKDIKILKYFPQLVRLQIINKFPKIYGEALENDITVINYFPEDHRMEILKKYKELFKRIFLKNKEALKHFPRKHRGGILAENPDVVSQFDPKSVRFVAKANRHELLKKHPTEFGKFFAQDPRTIGLFLPKHRMSILDKFEDAFREGFKTNISSLNFFPKKNHGEILTDFKDSFAELIKNDPEQLDFFPDEKISELKEFLGV